jgi:hypothetical protein
MFLVRQVDRGLPVDADEAATARSVLAEVGDAIGWHHVAVAGRFTAGQYDQTFLRRLRNGARRDFRTRQEQDISLPIRTFPGR